jgi:peptide-methionine (S)-S-oxide reductase
MKTRKNSPTKLTSIGLGGGCHWCTEAVFASLKGIVSVEQGWISAASPDDSFSEAVLIKLDEQQISLRDIIEIHLYTHSSTSDHGMRKKYRSAIYVLNDSEKQQVEGLLEKIQKEFSEKLITRALLFKAFKKSDEEYLDYYYKNPDKPFCQTYIQPKLKTLMKRHPKTVNHSKLSKGYSGLNK